MDELFKNMMQPFNGTWDAVESNMAVLENILVRLPVRRLLIFKSVSKLWYGVISAMYFIKLQQYWSKKNPKDFIFYDGQLLKDRRIVYEMYQMEPNGVYSESYVIKDLEALYYPHLVSCFNGLICCMNIVDPYLRPHEVDLRICNPATREVLLLPRGQSSVYTPNYGLAYSYECHLYKIFKFFNDPIDKKEGFYQCEVYSSQTGVWKQLGRVPLRPMFGSGQPLTANHVCINEKVYWIIPDKENISIPGSILMVDMDEKFREIQLPTDAVVPFLIEFCDHLCFVSFSGLNIVIWTYDEKKDGWCMLGMPKLPVPWQVVVFDSVVAHGRDILFVGKDRSWLRHELLYDVDLGTWKDFHVAEDSKSKLFVVFPFFETLLPCGGMSSQRT